MGRERKLHSSSYTQKQFVSLHLRLRLSLTHPSGGFHISNPKQREHSIEFLRHIQRIMGFSTQSTITLLLDQWRDLD